MDQQFLANVTTSNTDVRHVYGDTSWADMYICLIYVEGNTGLSVTTMSRLIIAHCSQRDYTDGLSATSLDEIAR